MQATRCLLFIRRLVITAAISALVLTACTSEPDGGNEAADNSIPHPAPERNEPEGEPAVATTPAAGDCELTVGWDPWEPYHYVAIGGQPQGLDIEIVRAVADHADCELEFLQGGWDGLLRLLRAGELDLMLGASRTPAREEWARFSVPYRDETFRLFVLERLADDYTGRDLEALLADGFRLGVTQGYYYGPDVSAIIERPAFDDQVLEAAVGELNFTWLLDMQIDGFIEDPVVAAAIERRRRDAEPIVALPQELSSGRVTFMFSRSSVPEAIVERFDAGIEALRASGRQQQLLDRYLEWKGDRTTDTP